ncbi:MAG: CDF family Co(II)/Ni(II) efflux transporter DmeF [Alphaproteobacteria bacterium]|nr:CDF family Co(II)/Ni(II) efflux transporter DmeF [Alphaproteobacteria bacterium]MDE2109913.1 CDF family Co(II)/Ni(II) efflux transporter DmeF [Alphaproteobacteria bacterium]MDE2492658.1 CDF family Co(II)/Ni(II) efflux transporter DmeF [Alphaproteobacteria bacterium]
MTSKTHDHADWSHGHIYLGHAHERAEARTKLVAMLTAVFMAFEIAAGLLFHSMALLADGVHMATHVGALGLAAGAYWLARRHANDARFSFGSGKFGDLAAFSSAIILGLLAFGVVIESVRRLIEPVGVHYEDALVVAALGLAVNVASAVLLHEPHVHHIGDGRAHSHDHDHNLRAAYLHVLADAATSVLAIFALGSGLFFGLAWADPLVGVVGAVVISSWAYGLVRESALVLLDAEDDPALARDIKTFIEGEANSQVLDLHLWRLGPGHRGLIVSLVCGGKADNEQIKHRLVARYPSLSHVTVEVSVCADCASQS